MIKVFYACLFINAGIRRVLKMYCYNCNLDVDAQAKKEKRSYSYREHHFSIMEEVFYCPNCGLELVDNLDDDLARIYDGYLNLFGLSLSSFKKIRESLHLDCKRFAKALGWAYKSIYRYENGESIPEGEYLSVYIKLHKNKDYILEKLYQNRINLTNDEYYDILNRINLKFDIKSRNVILYILGKSPKHIINIVKTLFAIDFYSMKERGKAITKFKYVKMQYGPNIDKYVDLFNDMSSLDEIKICDSLEINGDLKNQYINNINFDKALFTKEELELINYVLMKTAGKSAKQLSDWSHYFKGWIDTDMGKEINMKKYAKYFDINNL